MEVKNMKRIDTCKQCLPPLIEFYNGSLFLVAGAVLCKKCKEQK